VIFLLACVGEPESVLLYGIVEDDAGGEGSAVEGATLVSLDEGGLSSNEPYGTTETLEDGSFVVDVPAGEAFFLTVSAPELVSTAWSGTAGMVDQYAGHGVPWVAKPEWVDALRVEHAGCPTASETGGIVTGEVRAYVSGLDYDEMPLVDDASVTVTDGQSNELRTCHLDASGVSDPDAALTGATGRFAVFGVPEGPILVDVVVDTDVEQSIASYRYRMPSEGLVPMFPALLEGL
jgi:hypothetical protein